MHYVTDVAAGLITGIVSALLAYGWYHDRARLATLETATNSGPNRRNCK